MVKSLFVTQKIGVRFPAEASHFLNHKIYCLMAQEMLFFITAHARCPFSCLLPQVHHATQRHMYKLASIKSMTSTRYYQYLHVSLSLYQFLGSLGGISARSKQIRRLESPTLTRTLLLNFFFYDSLTSNQSITNQ